MPQAHFRVLGSLGVPNTLSPWVLHGQPHWGSSGGGPCRAGPGWIKGCAIRRPPGPWRPSAPRPLSPRGCPQLPSGFPSLCAHRARLQGARLRLGRGRLGCRGRGPSGGRLHRAQLLRPRPGPGVLSAAGRAAPGVGAAPGGPAPDTGETGELGRFPFPEGKIPRGPIRWGKGRAALGTLLLGAGGSARG